MTGLGEAWLGGDDAPCLTRDQWEGRVTEVHPDGDACGEWWFAAVLVPVDGIGSVRTDVFLAEDVSDADRGMVRVGAPVRTLHETVRGRYGVEARFEVMVRREEDGRDLWVRHINGMRGSGSATEPLADPGSSH